jgi:hypothetical protein
MCTVDRADLARDVQPLENKFSTISTGCLSVGIFKENSDRMDD